MKVPMSWLNEYVDVTLPMEEFVSAMIMHGLGVEGVSSIFADSQRVVVGKITKIEKHPNADKLQVCTVLAGEKEPVTILTAAPNVYEGMVCPVALDGATLPTGKHITAGEMRGLTSYGMLCSGGELRVEESDIKNASVDGILDMGKAYEDKIGMPFFTAIGLDSPVVEFEISANRGDCMSVLGIAREVSAALGVPLREPEIHVEEIDEPAAKYATVEIQAPDLCPRYIARVLTDIHVGESPLWMQRRLMGAGVRPISNMVDITNYVMLELGYPMHAFDYSCVKDGHIVVCTAQNGERLTTLDGKEYTLDDSVLVIADRERAIGLAGVMGGENSEITPETTMVLLESAKFDGFNNRKTSRGLGILSEAASRFTKGLDDQGIQMASDRAAQLMVEIGCGKVLRGRVDTQKEAPALRTVRVRPDRVNHVLGTDFPEEIIMECLTREGIAIQEMDEEGALICTIPSHRMDLAIEEDLIEEVARVAGYESIPTRLLEGFAQGGLTPVQSMRERTRSGLAAMGLYETMSLSFLGNKVLEQVGMDATGCVRLQNPLSEEYSIMRRSLIPGMIQSLGVNMRNKIYNRPLFEMSNVHLETADGSLPVEKPMLCLGAIGESFYEVKGYLEELFRIFGISDLHFAAGGGDYLHPGRKAEIFLHGSRVGEIGELHPQVLENFAMDRRAVVAEIAMDAIYENAIADKRYQPLNRFPVVERDLAVMVDRGAPVGAMMESIQEQAGALLSGLSIFDIYEGDQVEAGKKSVAFSLSFQAPDRTLTGDEVQSLMESILACLKEKYQAMLRG